MTEQLNSNINKKLDDNANNNCEVGNDVNDTNINANSNISVNENTKEDKIKTCLYHS
jgi:hypothetical protein